jgi:hypothetical protein
MPEWVRLLIAYLTGSGGVTTEADNGSGQYGGNGSVHWQTVEGGAVFEGVDKVPLSLVGASYGKPGHLKVALRYDSPEQMRAALDEMIVEQEPGKTIVHLLVPVRHRVDFNRDDQPHEIRVWHR